MRIKREKKSVINYKNKVINLKDFLENNGANLKSLKCFEEIINCYVVFGYNFWIDGKSTKNGEIIFNQNLIKIVREVFKNQKKDVLLFKDVVLGHVNSLRVRKDNKIHLRLNKRLFQALCGEIGFADFEFLEELFKDGLMRNMKDDVEVKELIFKVIEDHGVTGYKEILKLSGSFEYIKKEAEKIKIEDIISIHLPCRKINKLKEMYSCFSELDKETINWDLIMSRLNVNSFFAKSYQDLSWVDFSKIMIQKEKCHGYKEGIWINKDIIETDNISFLDMNRLVSSLVLTNKFLDEKNKDTQETYLKIHESYKDLDKDWQNKSIRFFLKKKIDGKNKTNKKEDLTVNLLEKFDYCEKMMEVVNLNNKITISNKKNKERKV